MNYIFPVGHKLAGFRYYTENIEQFFQQRRHHLEDLIQTSIKEGEDPLEWWADDYWLTTETSLMRMSLFLSLYAFLELILKELCRFEQIGREILLAPTDLTRNTGIKESKIYLEKVVCINFSFGESQEWGKIRNYQKLRNHLAHKGLWLTYEDFGYKSLIQFIKQHPKLDHKDLQISDTKLELSPEEIEELRNINYEPSKKSQLWREGFLGSGSIDMSYNNIELKAGFCEEVIETIDSFWNKLIKAVQETNTPSDNR